MLDGVEAGAPDFRDWGDTVQRTSLAMVSLYTLQFRTNPSSYPFFTVLLVFLQLSSRHNHPTTTNNPAVLELRIESSRSCTLPLRSTSL